MNKDSIISKFISKCGPLDPKPQYGFAQGSQYVKIGTRVVQGPRFGITTTPSLMFEKMKKKFQEEWNHLPNNLTVSTADEILPFIMFEKDGECFEWDQNNLLDAMLMFQNRPFDKVMITRFKDEPIPMLFSRKDVNVSVLLAPRHYPIPLFSNLAKERKKKIRSSEIWKGKGLLPEEWKSQILNTTFWLVEWPTDSPDSVEGHIHGYPIGRMLKCRKCGCEMTIQDWTNRYVRDNHPECQCSCDTYEDYCGCRRRREMSQYDRIRRESTIKKHFMRNHWDMS